MAPKRQLTFNALHSVISQKLELYNHSCENTVPKACMLQYKKFMNFAFQPTLTCVKSHLGFPFAPLSVDSMVDVFCFKTIFSAAESIEVK
jgi:hypothetical protein